MNPTFFPKSLLLLATLFIPIKANTSPYHQNAPHVHGISEILLMIRDTGIEIQLKSPASNIVGFEHAAETFKEKALVKQAKATLSSSKSLFIFNGTSCTPISSLINVLGLLHNVDESPPSKNHKEVSGQYQFKCQSTVDLKNIEVHLFKEFPNISQIKVQWISKNEQGMSILKPSQNQLVIGG